MDNEVLKNIRERRSIRKYRSDAVDGKLLDLVLEAGTWAPSAMDRQPSTIVCVTDKEDRDRLSRMNAEIMGTDRDPYYGAPVIILVLGERSVSTYIQDGSLVLENMMLAAHSLGLGSCWINREAEMFDSREGKELLEKWNLPTTLGGVGALALGYVDGDVPKARERKKNYIVKIREEFSR